MVRRRLRTGLRGFPRRARQRLLRHGDSLLLSAGAAGISYALAGLLFWPGQPFFAPIAAVVTIGLAAGQRIRRAAEIAGGVVLGLLVADVFVLTVGTGPLQLAGAVLIASTVAVVALGAGNLMSNQAAVAAVLVVALMPVDANPFGPFGRLLEALIGGGTALVLNAVFSPDPLRRLRRVAVETLGGFHVTLEDIGTAIRDQDIARAHAALEATDVIAKKAQQFDEALSMARESSRLARHRRAILAQMGPLVALRARMDILVSTMRGLARSAANAVRHGRPLPAELCDALDHLANALQAMTLLARAEGSADAAQREALHAATVASELLAVPHDLRISIMVGHIRSATIDVLRATGVEHEQAVRMLEDAAGRADRWS